MTREGLEASLIVGIVLGYLKKTENRHYFRAVWAGIAAAVAVSIGLGAGLFFTVGELSGRAEQVFEGTVMLSAVLVLTWMIFWMRKQAVNIKSDLESRLADALAAGSGIALGAVAFIAVAREGWESALFLFAISESSSKVSTGVGAAIGLIVAVSLGAGVYLGSRRLNLRQFFTATGVFLIVFAAGLLARATLGFQQAGAFPRGVAHLWNTGGIVGGSSHAGKFLTALFGYDASPSLVQVIVWACFVAAALWFFLRPLMAPRSEARPATAPSSLSS
jgi:high-affinity iron transporter